jgi:hypothetical protein
MHTLSDTIFWSLLKKGRNVATPALSLALFTGVPGRFILASTVS